MCTGRPKHTRRAERQALGLRGGSGLLLLTLLTLLLLNMLRACYSTVTGRDCMCTEKKRAMRESSDVFCLQNAAG